MLLESKVLLSSNNFHTNLFIFLKIQTVIKISSFNDGGLKFGRFDILYMLFPFLAFVYGLETVVSVLFSNTCTRLLYNEREIFNTARSEAECSIENFEFIVQ